MLCLLDLPNEILERIAAPLDTDSLVALASINRRLERISLHALRYVRVKRITKSLLKWSTVNGSVVRRLDLSNCESCHVDLNTIITMCPLITELNVVNSNFHDLNILSCLKKLESFSMTAPSKERLVHERFHSIREVYIESLQQKKVLTTCMNFLNLCTAIEVIHINLLGSPMRDLSTMPRLAAERWSTLHTVICSCHHATRGEGIRALLLAIFAHKLELRIKDWIDQDRDYYIYEYGNFVNNPLNNIIPNENVRLLKRYHCIDLPIGGNIAGIFESTWGSPRAVRVNSIKCPLTTLEGYLSTTLVELNLRECHNDYPERFRFKLITAVPRLEDLACTLCFFLPPDADWPLEKERPLLNCRFEEALQELKLKKLFVEGFHFVTNYDFTGCTRCQVPLSSANLVNLEQLKYLEELTFNGVDVEATAYRRLSNPNVVTLKLCLNAKNNYTDLQTLIRRCKKLKHLKLEGFDLQLHVEKVWEALVEGEKLKQLCLRTGIKGSCGPFLSHESLDCLVKILRRLEFLHLHHPDTAFPRFLRSMMKPFKHEHLLEKVFSDSSAFSARNIKSVECGGLLFGRALCYSETSIGIVPPVGWAIE